VIDAPGSVSIWCQTRAGIVDHVAFGDLEFPGSPELWPLFFLGPAIIDPIHPFPTEEGGSRPVQDDVDVPIGGVDLGLGIAGPVDDLHVVMSIIVPWQCIQVHKLGTKDTGSVAEFSLELVLKLGERLRIPMEVFSGTWLFANQGVTPNDPEFTQLGVMRAFAKATGDVVWERPIDTSPRGTSMTYPHEGKRYMVLGVGGGDSPPGLRAYALP
jgi:hypothetical protein